MEPNIVNRSETQEAVKLTPDELAMIDAVEPYVPGTGYTADEVLERARKRTTAWMQAVETTVPA